uniref:Uncharacterized protein n=1 Tax=Anguilla anguilla TaxID=7936 RepID=A0A0E9WRY0_ANGAN
MRKHWAGRLCRSRWGNLSQSSSFAFDLLNGSDEAHWPPPTPSIGVNSQTLKKQGSRSVGRKFQRGLSQMLPFN